MTFFIPEELVAQQKLGEDSAIFRFIRLIEKINSLTLRVKRLLLAVAASDGRFSQGEIVRVRQHQCRANMRGVPTRGQGLYEAKHGTHGVPFQNLPEHIRDSYETCAASGQCGYNFRGNNSAYRRR